MASSPKLVPPPPLDKLDTSVLVDMLGPLEEELDTAQARLTPIKKKAEAITKILKSRADGPDAQTFDGAHYFALIGERNNETSPDVEAIFKKLPRALFFALVTIGVEKLKALRPKDWEKLVSQERTGARAVVTHRQPTTEVQENVA